MKRSKSIQLFALSAVAAATLLGCGNQAHLDEQKNCVDEKGVVLPDSQCQPGGVGYHPGAYWYYGGSRFYHPGMVVGGGSRIPVAGKSYFAPTSPHFNSAPSSVSRGGFGTSAKSGGFSAGT